MKFKKNWIKMNDDSNDQVTEVITEKKEEEKMSFFAKHKKGLILGGIGALAAGAAGLIIASRKDSDDVDDEDFDLDDFEDAELEELASEEEKTEG